MMIITALLSGAALAGSADGIDHELSLETGSMHTSDETWDAFSYGSQVGAWGVRAGYGISPNLALVASLHRGRHRSDVGIDSDSSYQSIDMDLTTSQVALGPKVDLQVNHWLRPYATIQGMGVLGEIRIDDDPSDDDNELLRYRDATFGGFAAAGIELIPGSTSRRLHVGTHLELGYGKVLAMQFQDKDAGNDPIEIGDLDMQGFTINAGIGVRF
jgi:hypothetical protein